MKETIYLLLTVLVISLANAALAGVEPPKNPNSAKACAICHYRWIDTFFVEGRGTDIVEYQSEKVAATPEMCFSCHDGSIKDSRAKINQNSEHKTNIAPPENMKIPKIFPLDEKGLIQCATCHTAHGVASGEGTDETIFMRISNKNSAMCRMCHTEMDGGKDTGSHPVGKISEDIPETLRGQVTLPGGEKKKLVCESCHTAHGSPYESYLAYSAQNSVLCFKCHEDKNPFSPEGQKKQTHVVNVIPSKAKIPDRLIRKGAKLGERGNINCLTCHKMHKNESHKHLLLVENDGKSSLCLTCHSDKRGLTGTKHDLNVSAPKEKNLQGQTVAEAGICSACHLPHKPARKLAEKGDPSTRHCQSCHSKGNVGEKVHLKNNLHPLGVNPFEKERAKRVFAGAPAKKRRAVLPLYNKWGIQDKNGNMACPTCHDIHGGLQGSAKKDEKTDSGGDRTSPGSFLRKPSPALCRECHPDKFSLADSEHDLKVSAPEVKNNLGKTPSESGICGSCHVVHGPFRGSLWVKKTISDGDNILSVLCQTCHTENGIAKKKVDTGQSHPVNILPSEMKMTTELPLFDRNGQTRKKGFLTCHSCHDPHQPGHDSIKAKTVKKIRAREQMSFLRKPSQKICIDCHRDKSAVARSKHDLKKTAPDARNVLNQTPKETGLCGNCHLAHNGQQPFLWARDLDVKTGNLAEDICISCHNEQGLAPKKPIKDYSHPVNVSPVEEGLSTTLPLFDRNGKSAEQGLMTCLTCHEPHRWNPLKRIKGDHYDLEGSPRDSFLRLEAVPSPRLCGNCHKDKVYIENTDHDLRVSAPSFKNIIGQTPAESGVCGVCHLVHNSQNWINLWALKLDWRGNINDMQCTSCHSPKGIAKNKVPAISSHPDEVLINNLTRSAKKRADYFPLFHKSYGELTTIGNISCPSCHNAHRWGPRAEDRQGKGINVEGDAMNSFLRSRSSMLPCMECHGLEGLYRYKFFHKAKARKVGKDRKKR